MTGERKMDLGNLHWLQMGNSDGRKPGDIPGVLGPSLKASDGELMMRAFACGHMCPVNKYDEDGKPDKRTLVDGQDEFWAGYTQMTITQMRDHLVDYHVPKGHYVDADLLKRINRRAKEIEQSLNDRRRAQEAVDAKELEDANKTFAKIRSGA